MQMKQWLFAQLGFIAFGISFLVYVIPPPGRLEGGFFLAIGAMNIVFNRRLGRQVFNQSRFMRSNSVRKYWDIGGERGSQLLYLGIGFILSAAGCVLVMKSFL